MIIKVQIAKIKPNSSKFVSYQDPFKFRTQFHEISVFCWKKSKKNLAENFNKHYFQPWLVCFKDRFIYIWDTTKGLLIELLIEFVYFSFWMILFIRKISGQEEENKHGHWTQ